MIRDHETIRMIGRGAFGEVWIARSVTGVMRAVKVVWRDDYDHSDAFEREFEAIKRYEPISRRHEGLVPILQVGRSDEEGFYYYVMELADDLNNGREIDHTTYKPHTLGGQMRRDKRISAAQCMKLGTHIAEALHYLHGNKLIHRDVKPSNLIYIDGTWRLADIGLVALLGQRSFVGTEGFVAPEGPGSAASDIFSLGMVLYEASTGKDRLDFPDVPSCSETGERLDVWRRLNRVTCRACAPKAKDRYETAHEMALDLLGEPLPSRRRGIYWAAAGVSALVLATGFGMWLAQSPSSREMLGIRTAAPLLTITSDPPGAVVFAAEENLGVTPLEIKPREGVPVIYQLRLPGYRHQEIEHIAQSGEKFVADIKLEKSILPQAGERWVNSIGMEFKPRSGGHVTVAPVEMRFFKQFLEASNRSFEGKVVRSTQPQNGRPSYIVVAPVGDAEAFRYWLTDLDRNAGFLSQEHHYEVEPFYFVDDASSPDEPADGREPDAENDEAKNWQAFHLRVVRQTYGVVTIHSAPDGVRVYQHDELLGRTPLEIPRVKAGSSEFELREEGFSDTVLEGEVKEGEILELYANMEAKTGISYGREWHNGFGALFVPLGDILMASAETRRKDYLEFAKATGTRRPTGIDEAGNAGGKAASQPVISITRDEARAFCTWLTERERSSGLLTAEDTYRLPTDEEWSRAVGLPLERGSDPSQRNGRIRGIYPWGFDWPPPNNTDNFADLIGARRAAMENVIPEYEDKFPFLAPATALPANEHGLRGLAGNVSEWVDTDFETAPTPSPTTSTPITTPAKSPLGTVRGGNWRSATQEELLSSARIPVPPDTRRNTIGFRCVVSRIPPKE